MGERCDGASGEYHGSQVCRNSQLVSERTFEPKRHEQAFHSNVPQLNPRFAKAFRSRIGISHID